MAVTTVIRAEYFVPNHPPCMWRLRSTYGIRSKKARATVGTRTPAQALSMCSSSSWRLRKYQGALDGLGVTLRFARFKRGALMKTERIRKVTVNSTAETNSMKTRSGQTRTSSSRSRFGRGLAGTAGAGLWASTALPSPPPPPNPPRLPSAPEVGRRAADAVADGDRPERELVPREEVAGKAEDKLQHEQHHAHHPVELSRRLVGPRVEHP